MTSISSITRQYSNKQKQTQKGGQGGVLGFFKGNDDITAAASNGNAAPKQETSLLGGLFGSSAEPKKDATAAPKEETSMLGKIFGSSEPKDATAVAASVPAPSGDAAAAPEEETGEKPSMLSGLFGSSKPEEGKETVSDAPAPASAPAPVPEPAKEENTSFLSGLIGTSKTDNASESEASENEEQEDVDFDFISQKMNKLRENYDALKKEHTELKSKLETEQAEAKKLDDSKVSTLIAAFTASQGALTAFKEALIDHLKNNNYPLDGLDTNSSETPLTQEPVAANEEQPAPAPAPEAVSEETVNDMSDAGSVSEPEPEAGSVSEEGSVSESDTGSVSDAGSVSEEGSVSDADTELQSQPQPQPQPEEAQQQIEEEVQSSTSLPEMPVNEEVPVSPAEEGQTPATSSESVPLPAAPTAPTAPAAAPEGQGKAPSGTIEGGRSHYVNSSHRKATTHRHHKRRNRHQTLRKQSI